MQGVLSIQSHVVYGHAGNSSAVFPLQRFGIEVWPIHTVQFSNHTEYEQGWAGRIFSVDEIRDLLFGIEKIDQLKNCKAILTGYQGSTEQCLAVIDIVNKVKEANPNAIYVCDPVMAAPDKCSSLSPEINEHLIQKLMPIADVIVPNQFELSLFVNMPIRNLNDAVLACKKALSCGPKIVLVKHLNCVSTGKFCMMLAVEDKFYLVQRPHIDFPKAPIGVGDLISSLFIAGLLKGWRPVDAFTHCNNAVYGVVKETSKRGEWELQTIAAQDELINPSESFVAQEILFQY